MTKLPDEHFAHDPEVRGLRVTYWTQEVNHCPACHRQHWFIGRISAECAFCSTALPLNTVAIV